MEMIFISETPNPTTKCIALYNMIYNDFIVVRNYRFGFTPKTRNKELIGVWRAKV